MAVMASRGLRPDWCTDAASGGVTTTTVGEAASGVRVAVTPRFFLGFRGAVATDHRTGGAAARASAGVVAATATVVGAAKGASAGGGGAAAAATTAAAGA